jgi:hypothetical protein
VTTKDFLITEVKGLFAASKNLEYRSRVVRSFRAFINFLQANGLTTRQILAAEEPVTESLRIMKSDLTDEGFEVVKAAYDKWRRGHDRGKEIEDVSVLEKALAKLRQAP